MIKDKVVCITYVHELDSGLDSPRVQNALPVYLL